MLLVPQAVGAREEERALLLGDHYLPKSVATIVQSLPEVTELPASSPPAPEHAVDVPDQPDTAGLGRARRGKVCRPAATAATQPAAHTSRRIPAAPASRRIPAAHASRRIPAAHASRRWIPAAPASRRILAVPRQPADTSCPHQPGDTSCPRQPANTSCPRRGCET